MNGNTKLLAPLVAALAAAACGGTSVNPASSFARSPAQNSTLPSWKVQHSAERVCPDVGPRYGQCMALLETGIAPNVSGWTPNDFRSRYHLPIDRGAGQVVAVVDAFDNPNVASDLAKYRRFFGLGKAKFTKYNQRGQPRNYPRANGHWGVEIDLDVEMVSAVCPKCTIDLIEADNNLITNLDKAELAAVKLKAHIVSNSWGCPGSNDCVDPSAYAAPRVLYLASAGDDGFGTQAPATLANVVAVGGTVLSKSGDIYSETTWNGTGSGCAKGIKKPSWQHDSGCAYRTTNDVSAVALDVAEYDSYHFPGWFLVGGTSISTPLVAGVFALDGNAGSQHAAKRFWTIMPRLRTRELHDVTTGGNTGYGGCDGNYLCSARRGYDGPTGWGTPNGIGAF